MAVLADITTSFGEARECYIRLHNIEANNHGEKATAQFRAYLSQAAHAAGGHPVREYTVRLDADVDLALWPQAYAALKAIKDPYWLPDDTLGETEADRPQLLVNWLDV